MKLIILISKETTRMGFEPTGEVNRVVKGVTLYPYTLK